MAAMAHPGPVPADRLELEVTGRPAPACPASPMNAPAHAPILAALRRLDATASSRGDVLPVLRELDELCRALPADAPADLRHYLQRRSYEKARLFLEGQDPEAGPCPR